MESNNIVIEYSHENDDECMICLDLLGTDNLWICEQCNVYIHAECMEKWKLSCPHCNYKDDFENPDNDIERENINTYNSLISTNRLNNIIERENNIEQCSFSVIRYTVIICCSIIGFVIVIFCAVGMYLFLRDIIKYNNKNSTLYYNN